MSAPAFQLWTIELEDGSAVDVAIANMPEPEALLDRVLKAAGASAYTQTTDDANEALRASGGLKA